MSKIYGIQTRENIKRLCLWIDTDKHARFLMWLRYHGLLRQGDFFRTFVDLCNEENPEAIKLVEQVKTERKLGKRNNQYAAKKLRESEGIMEGYNFDEEELEDLFNLIAKERDF